MFTNEDSFVHDREQSNNFEHLPVEIRKIRLNRPFRETKSRTFAWTDRSRKRSAGRSAEQTVQEKESEEVRLNGPFRGRKRGSSAEQTVQGKESGEDRLNGPFRKRNRGKFG